MKKLLITLLLTITTLFANISNDTTKSVVKVFTTTSTANYKQPWQTNKILKFTGSGAIIQGNQIITSAHVVAGGKLIEVRKENDPKKYIAKLKYISHQVDIAILEVEDQSFFDNTSYLKLSTDVKARDSVTVVGYPIGGNNISTTTGVVSRIEQQYYVYSGEKFLAIQIDAAVNSGNSGGPAVNSKNELIGIAMMTKKKANNISYIVPTEIINTVLEDTKDGKIDGFNRVLTYVANIENNVLKEYYGLNNGNGAIVGIVDQYETQIKLDDIVLSIDGKLIANNGTIASKYGRISFAHVFHTKQMGESIELDILRDKKLIKVKLAIKQTPKLINYEYDKQSRYIIFGGLAFSPITSNYLRTLTNFESTQIKKKLYAKKVEKDFTEAVTMLPSLFPHSVNRGYSSWASVVKNVNGIRIKNFKHFTEVLDYITDKYIKIEFMQNATVILDSQKARNSFKDIQYIYQLSSDRNINK